MSADRIGRLRLLLRASARTRAASGAAWLSVLLLGTWRGFLDFVCVYAWFRWADDAIDRPDRHTPAVQSFVLRQRARIAALCRSGDPPDTGSGESAPSLLPLGEKVAAQPPDEGALHGFPPSSGPSGHLLPRVGEGSDEAELTEILALSLARPTPLLRRSVLGMWSALEADAARDHAPVPEPLLLAQIRRVGDAYTDALLHACSLPPDHPAAAPDAPLRDLARAATAVHHLRDLLADRDLGYLNLPPPWAHLTGLDPLAFTAADARALARWRAPLLLASFARGAAALPALPWRARWLLSLFAWRYRRLLLRLCRDDV